MSIDQLILIIHITAATMWIGGNLFICVAYLPNALKKKSPGFINSFSVYEPIGLSALVVSFISGVYMAYRRGIGILDLFQFRNPMELTISIKLGLFILMVIMIIIAKLTIVKRIKRHEIKQLPKMAAYIITLTFAGLVFLVLGTYLRYGGIIF